MMIRVTIPYIILINMSSQSFTKLKYPGTKARVETSANY